ncbi:hypothetical protein DW886_27825 [Enterocloster aldenensis]|nr:hypothetical protein DW886_27825 [Enterocloster aldenensis]
MPWFYRIQQDQPPRSGSHPIIPSYTLYGTLFLFLFANSRLSNEPISYVLPSFLSLPAIQEPFTYNSI